MKTRLATVIACTLMFGAAVAHADEAGDWVFKVGVAEADPKSDNASFDNGALQVDVGSAAQLSLTGEYLFTPNWGMELLASIPFEHDIKINGTTAARVKQLPPTLSVQYHFNPGGSVSPFVGLGLNYTIFFNEHTTGPLAGTDLSLGSSLGPALHAGLDFRLNDRWLITGDIRWMHMSTDAKVNGVKLGTVDIDPFVYGLAIGYRF